MTRTGASARDGGGAPVTAAAAAPVSSASSVINLTSGAVSLTMGPSYGSAPIA